MSERRIRNSRIRRRRELRKNILLFVTTLSLAISLFFSVGSFLSNAKNRPSTAEYKYYVSIPVESGDTLWSIAREHMGPHYDSEEDYIKEVCRINSISGDSIKSGAYIIVPYYSTEFVP